MFFVLLLAICGLAALVTSLIAGCAKPGLYNGFLLQKENWLGYLFLSIAFFVAALHRFQDIDYLYELKYGRHIGLDYIGIDLNQPLPLIYVVLALGATCYFVWRGRTRKFEPRQRRRVVSEVIALAAITVIITFGCFIWPTPWEYRTEPILLSGGLPGPLEYQGHFVTEFRTNRLTGENQAKMGDHWEHEFDRM